MIVMTLTKETPEPLLIKRAFVLTDECIACCTLAADRQSSGRYAPVPTKSLHDVHLTWHMVPPKECDDALELRKLDLWKKGRRFLVVVSMVDHDFSIKQSHRPFSSVFVDKFAAFLGTCNTIVFVVVEEVTAVGVVVLGVVVVVSSLSSCESRCRC
jgi:hypothetical protein